MSVQRFIYVLLKFQEALMSEVLTPRRDDIFPQFPSKMCIELHLSSHLGCVQYALSFFALGTSQTASKKPNHWIGNRLDGMRMLHRLLFAYNPFGKTILIQKTVVGRQQWTTRKDVYFVIYNEVDMSIDLTCHSCLCIYFWSLEI